MDEEYIDKDKIIHSNIDNVSVFSYIYVNAYLISYIRNILFNSNDLIYEILKISKKSHAGPKIDVIDKYLDKFLYIPSTIYFIKVSNKKIKSNKDYVNLSSVILNKILGKNETKKIIDFLKEYNIIECDGIYSEGSKCFGYRFSEKFRQMMDEGKLKFTKKYTKLNIVSQYVQKFDNSNFILDCFNYLDFDVNMAEKIKNDFLAAETKNFQEKDDYYSFIIDSWRDKFFYIKCGQKTNRLFTLLSSTPKIFRGCLRIRINDGLEGLYNCDIKSCQPLLLYTFYKDKSNESEKYKQLVESGLFYKTVVESLGEDYNEENKEYYKNAIWEWAFGSVVYPKTYCIDNFFTKNYPILTNLLKKAKKREFVGEKNPHSKVPIHLQKMESSIMVELLSKFCLNNKIKYFTIHDSVLCCFEDVNKIKTFIIEQFRKHYDLNPDINVEKIS